MGAHHVLPFLLVHCLGVHVPLLPETREVPGDVCKPSVHVFVLVSVIELGLRVLYGSVVLKDAVL